MPTTTPNYGWSVPVSTDLVKDGATAIELLGDSIDTSLVDLLGGTTGQVLTKASGTDLDFSFTTPAALSRGLNEIIPTSVAVGSGTATVGANGQITFTTVGTNLSINGVFSSTYTNYKMVMDFDDSANNSAVIRLRVGGTDNTTASSYISQTLQAQSTTVSTARSTQSYWNEPFFSNSNATNAVEMNFYRPFPADTTAFTTLAISSASGAHLFVACGTHNGNTSFDGFSIINGSTNTLSGALRIYGWNE